MQCLEQICNIACQGCDDGALLTAVADENFHGSLELPAIYPYHFDDRRHPVPEQVDGLPHRKDLLLFEKLRIKIR
jgi:hypothetical protein